MHSIRQRRRSVAHQATFSVTAPQPVSCSSAIRALRTLLERAGVIFLKRVVSEQISLHHSRTHSHSKDSYSCSIFTKKTTLHTDDREKSSYQVAIVIFPHNNWSDHFSVHSGVVVVCILFHNERACLSVPECLVSSECVWCVPVCERVSFVSISFQFFLRYLALVLHSPPGIIADPSFNQNWN